MTRKCALERELTDSELLFLSFSTRVEVCEVDGRAPSLALKKEPGARSESGEELFNRFQSGKMLSREKNATRFRVDQATCNQTAGLKKEIYAADGQAGECRDGCALGVALSQPA